MKSKIESKPVLPQEIQLAEKGQESTIKSSESQNIEDNMSISELIAQKYKKNIKVNKLKTPDEAAKFLIKDTSSFNVNAVEYTEGTSQD